MIQKGQITLFAFPQTDQAIGKLRPALILRPLPGSHGDWLICMISSQLYHEVPEFDEIIRDTDSDFLQTGLKQTSLIRVTRLAVVSSNLLEGGMGTLSEERLNRIYSCLANWIHDTQDSSESKGKKISEQNTSQESN
jgi:mRNA interferase MazF